MAAKCITFILLALLATMGVSAQPPTRGSSGGGPSSSGSPRIVVEMRQDNIALAYNEINGGARNTEAIAAAVNIGNVQSVQYARTTVQQVPAATAPKGSDYDASKSGGSSSPTVSVLMRQDNVATAYNVINGGSSNTKASAFAVNVGNVQETMYGASGSGVGAPAAAP